jgi:hypothetical protein
MAGGKTGGGQAIISGTDCRSRTTLNVSGIAFSSSSRAKKYPSAEGRLAR